MKILRGLAVGLLLVMLPTMVASQATVGSSGGFAGGDVSAQTNFCGPDNGTNVEIGSCTTDANAGAGGTNTVIGNNASNGSAAGAIVIGSTATLGGASTGVLIGSGSTATATGVVGLGNSQNHASNNNNVVVLGHSAAPGGAGNIILGASATGTGAGAQFVAGSGTAPVNNVYFGKGVSSTTATAYTVNGTGGSGADNAGGAVNIAPGIGNGTAVGGQVVLQRAQRNASGSSAQPLLQSFISCPVKILSNTSATVQAIATITTTTTTGGTVVMDYTSTACSGSTCDTDSGTTKTSWNNNAGTVAATMSAVYGQSDSDATGTLATTPTATVATSVVTINFTPTWVTIVPTTVHGYATFHVNALNSVVCQ